jgi:hypothetical protein
MVRYRITSKKSGNSRGNLTLKEAQALTRMNLLEFSKAIADGHDRLIIEEEKKPKSAPSDRDPPFWRRRPVTALFASIGVALLASPLFQIGKITIQSDEQRSVISAKRAEAKAAKARETPAQKAADCWGETDVFAAVAAQQEMKKHLKSPGTAKFPWFDNHVSDAGNCQFIVTSYVDSQNGFGGVVRTDFIASVQITGKGQATVEILTATQR